MSTKVEPALPRALARLYCPRAQAPVLEALLGVEAEIRVALKAGLEHDVAHARLAWWREECTRLSAGTPVHPLTRVLGGHFAGGRREVLADFGALVELASWDLARATFGSRRELTGYCERWSAALIVPLARAALPQAPAGALAFGVALKELELLLTLAPDARLGRLRLPLDELEAARIDPQELSAVSAGAALTRLLGAAHERARQGLVAATFAPEAQPALRALMVWGHMSGLLSKRNQAALPRLADPGEHQRAFDGLDAWRIARGADRGRLGAPEPT